MMAYKRTALYLHGLSEVDKSWMLNNLPGVHGEKLKSLLDDLKRLDIPTDRSLLANLETTEFNSGILNDEDDCLDIAIQMIDKAEASEIVDLLEQEPLELTAILLAVKDWSWKTSFLNFISSDKYKALVELEKSSNERVNRNVNNLIIRKISQKIQGVEVHYDDNESSEYLPPFDPGLQRYNGAART